VIGILGGIGSGKSTVAAEFGKLGCAVIDADRIARQLLDESPVKEKLVRAFGKEILDSAGNVDRRKLAEVVFTDGSRLEKLNSIIHPPVLRRVERMLEAYNDQEQVKAIVLDMPLLVEVGWEKRCDRLVFVDCREDLRSQRAEKMGLGGENQRKMRENFQISLDSKLAIADNVVDNNSGLSALARQVADIFSKITVNG